MKSLYLVIFLFVSTVAFAQSRPESYEDKAKALMAEHRYDEMYALTAEWKQKIPAEKVQADRYEILSDVAKIKYTEETSKENERLRLEEEKRQKEFDEYEAK